MYTQAMDIPSPDRDEAARGGPRSLVEQQRDAAYEAEFDARVARGEFIEPKDWMPEGYRKTLVRQISAARALRDRRHAARGQLDHARADAASARRSCSPRCRTRAATACTSTRRPRRSASRATSWSTRCTRGKAKYSSIFNYPTLTWADIGVIGWLVDGAAIMNQIPLCRCSYGPYARAMIRICKEESFHQRQGYDIC